MLTIRIIRLCQGNTTLSRRARALNGAAAQVLLSNAVERIRKAGQHVVIDMERV